MLRRWEESLRFDAERDARFDKGGFGAFGGGKERARAALADMAAVVDAQNARDARYAPMAPEADAVLAAAVTTRKMDVYKEAESVGLTRFRKK